MQEVRTLTTTGFNVVSRQMLRIFFLLLIPLIAALTSCGGARKPLNGDGPAYVRLSAPTIEDCPLERVICVGPDLEFDTNILSDEEAVRSAVDSARAGNTVALHGGTYKHNDNDRTFLTVSRSGTASEPIVIEALRGHKVIFEGWGFEDIAGEVPARDAEVIIRVTGDYVHVYNVEVHSSTRYGIDLSGNYGVLEDVIAHDCWWTNLIIGGMGGRPSNNNTIRGVESYRSHHGGGIAITRQSTDTTTAANNVIENSISYNNGYLANGQKVPVVPGDPSGGGNSDGIGTGKDCHDQASSPVNNLCPNTVIRNNVTWNNTDDGIDVSTSENAVISDNISFGSGAEGGRGFKGLRYVRGGITFIGNITMNNATTGLEPRAQDEIYVYHNLSAHHVRSGNFGINTIVNAPDPAVSKIINNLVYDNYNGISATTGVAQQTNWVSTVSSPASPDIPSPSFNSLSVNLTLPTSLSPAQKAGFIRAQFKAAFTPRPGSNLIDAATIIPGVHCATADDDAVNPMPPGAACRHWLGNAPDIGVFEAQ